LLDRIRYGANEVR